MSLEEKIKNSFRSTNNSIKRKRNKILETLIKDPTISKYTIDHENKEEYLGILERCVEESLSKYSKYLNSLYIKAGKISGLSLGLYQSWQALSSFYIPSVYGPLSALGLLGHITTEIPLLYKYLKETKDFSAIPKWLAYKAIEVIPIIGPFIGRRGLEKIIRGKIVKEAKKNFLDQIKKYKPIEEIIGERIKEKRRKNKWRIPAPVPLPHYKDEGIHICYV